MINVLTSMELHNGLDKSKKSMSVRQKAAKNSRNKKCTGGGPKKQMFSLTEERLFNQP